MTAGPSALAGHPDVRGGLDLLAAWIEAQIALAGVPGLSVGVVHDQTLVWARGFGWASLESRTPASPETLAAPAIWQYDGCQMVTTERIAAALGGPRVLKRGASSPEGLHSQLRAGLPYAALEAIASGFDVGRDDLIAVLHLPPRTLARRKRERRLRPDESDRLFRLGRIAALAEDVLGSREKASRWLHTPNRALGQAVPLRHLDTELGARQVEDLLVRIAHGVVS